MTTDHRAVMLALLQGRTYTVIEQTLGCSSKTISTARKALDAHGWTDADVTALTDDEIAQVFPDKRTVKDDSFAPIDISEFLARMRAFQSRHRGKKFTMKVEHERYVRQCQQAGTKPYSYSQYTTLVTQYIKAHEYSWPLTHEPGHKMFVDWSGDKLWVGQPGQPDSFRVSVFVATLPHSGMVFARCYPDERTPRWIQAHVDACEYFGGVPRLFVPDNASTASFRPRRDDPARDIAMDYRQFADYYGAGILPARPAKPTDKAHVERHVNIIQDWVGQYLDAYVFDTLDDLNAAVEDQVTWLNCEKTPYRGHNGHTRYQEFVDYEKSMLGPLPAVAYEPMSWHWVTPRPDCHFQIDKRRYSVPYTWVGTRLLVGLGQNSVKVYSPDGATLIVAHQRSYQRPGSLGATVSLAEHRLPNSTAFGNLWTRQRYETWSQHIGPNTYKAITIMLGRAKLEYQAFLPCENVLGLSKRYSNSDLEAACARVLATKRYVSYRTIKDTLTAGQNTTDGTTAASHSRTYGQGGQQSATTHVDQAAIATDFDKPSLRGFDAFAIPATGTTAPTEASTKEGDK